MTPRRTLTALTLVTAALLGLTACTTTSAPVAEESPQQAGAFPRTIEIPAGAERPAQTLTIEAEPGTIAALDYESAEIVAELGLAERLVLVPEAVMNPAIGGHVEEMSAVPNTFPVAMDLEAETVIALAPDLVIMSPRHGAEDTIGAVLEQAGLTSLQLPDSWTTPETLSTGIDLIGQATGTDDEAAELSSRIVEGLEQHASRTPGDRAEDAPRIMVLTNQAGRPFVTAGSAFPLQLVTLAGATSVSDELGIRATGPIAAEQIVETDPDGIVLIDMNGTGDRMYAELLANPAVAALPAVSEDRILRITGREVQALGLTETAAGLAKLTEWVSSLS